MQNQFICKQLRNSPLPPTEYNTHISLDEIKYAQTTDYHLRWVRSRFLSRLHGVHSNVHGVKTLIYSTQLQWIYL